MVSETPDIVSEVGCQHELSNETLVHAILNMTSNPPFSIKPFQHGGGSTSCSQILSRKTKEMFSGLAQTPKWGATPTTPSGMVPDPLCLNTSQNTGEFPLWRRSTDREVYLTGGRWRMRNHQTPYFMNLPPPWAYFNHNASPVTREPGSITHVGWRYTRWATMD